jgi:hypothetical protein
VVGLSRTLVGKLAASQAALDGELGKLARHASEPATGRHTAVYRAAAALGRHCAAGGLAEALVRVELETVATGALGLPADAELARAISNGLAAGFGKPYELKERGQ